MKTVSRMFLSSPGVMFAPLSKATVSSLWYWGMWLLGLLVVSVAFIVTMDTGSYLHSDEFVTLELGRVILNPDTDWSINWLVDQQQPVILFSYLGAVLQELTYEYGGQYGPRVSSLFGALVASTALVGWLLAKGTYRIAAFLLGMVFLLDPLIVQAFTIGRLDGWTMALCLSCCWIFVDTCNQLGELDPRIYTVRLLIAGSLACTALFIWPSAVFLFPLITVELFNLVNKIRSDGGKLQEVIRPVLLFTAGAIITALLLLLPIAQLLFAQFSNALQSIKANTHSGSSEDPTSILQNSIGIVRALKFSPFVVLLAFMVVFRCRQSGYVFSSLVVLALMVSTLVYINRVQYLIPYFIVCISNLFQHQHDSETSRILRMSSLTLLLLWSIGLSLGLRTYLALDSQADRDRKLVSQAALSLVGPGDHKVYVPYEFYHSGRSLGWKMYRAYLAYGNPLTPEMLKKVLSHVDYVIMLQPQLTKETNRALIEEGWLDKGNFHLYNKPAEPFDGITTNDIRVRNLYSIFQKPYGPYKLYVREKHYSFITAGKLE
ncbi:hypothetical protein ACFS7Z_20440 [Pontibacter toksunensis]|uniref:Glycosyltransferase RgtA/B/C/D-like domain-containing protein n=1 Tax=Pontibacter toksunensis TaxID=1332631 RepID=A0ABW6C0Q7_9BACT